MSICPNINLPEWKALENRVGKFEAFRDFMETGGEIRDPEIVALKISTRNNDNNYQLSRTDHTGEPISNVILERMLKVLTDKFDGDYHYRFVNDSSLDWKGKVEPGSELNGYKTTIVINKAKATLDTPLHEFGHIFLNMIKVGNKNLYFRLMSNVFNTEEGKAMLKEVEELYAEKNLSKPELQEEAIVELLGRQAAGLIDKRTGLSKVLSEIWKAIVDIFKDIMTPEGANFKVDVINLKPSTPLESLAQMLANKDIHVTVGSLKNKLKQDAISKLNKEITQLQNQLNKLSEVGVDNLTSIFYNEFGGRTGVNIIIDDSTANRINNLKENWSNIVDYANNDLKKDSERFAEWLENQSGSEIEIKKNFEENPTFDLFRWFLKSSDGAGKLIEQSIKRKSQGSKTFLSGSTIDYHFNNVRDILNRESAGDIISKVLLGRNSILAPMLDVRSIMNSRSFSQEQPSQTILFLNDRLGSLQERLNRTTKGNLLLIKEFNVEYVHPDTGVVEQDTIAVRTDVDKNPQGVVVNVSFSSKLWKYEDPVWLREITPEAVRRMNRRGKTDKKEQVAYQADLNDWNIQGSDAAKTQDRAVVNYVHNGIANIKFIKREPFNLKEHKEDDGSVNVPIEKLRWITRQSRALDVMTKVIDAVSELHYDTVYNTISFNAAHGHSATRKKGEEREYLYRKAAARLFGEYYIETRDDEQGVIHIPPSFRSGFAVTKELYQKERKVTSEIPIGSKDENTLTGLAVKTYGLNTTLDLDSINNTRAIEFANKLSTQLGIDYQIVSSKEAEELTKDAKNPWKGEKTFFIGGRVYFVGEHLSTSMILHEFAHPLVRAIGMENPKLFNNLMSQIANTHDGKLIIDQVKRLYPELNTNDSLFQEEIIVRALEQSALNDSQELQTDADFKKVINNILYAIKQFLRKLFGKKISVSKLNANTTVNELADMLMKGNNFSLDTEQISQEDVVAYMREQQKYIEDLQNIKSDEIQALVNKVYDISSRHIDALMSRKEYDELAQILTDEFQRGDLQEIKSRVQSFQTMVINKAKSIQQDLEHDRKRATALVDTIFRLETVIEKVLNHMKDISQYPDTFGNMNKAYYYDYFVKYWEGFIDELNEALNDPKNDVPNNSPLNNLVDNITRNVKKIKNLTNEMYADGVRDTLYEELSEINKSVKERYDTILKNLKDRDAPQRRIDKIFKQYHGVTEAQFETLKDLRANKNHLTFQQKEQLERLEREANKGLAITPEKIEALLKGELGDANFFNSYLEGYLYNTDPIIGGLSLFVKNKMNEVMVKAQAKFNEFSEDIMPLLKELGINFTNIGELGKKVGFVDTQSTRDKEGNLIERKVWTFLNPFKNYRYAYDLHRDKVEKAQLAYLKSNSEEDYQALIQAINDRKEFTRKYFHQEYVDEYYDRQKLFEKDDVGKEALYLRNNLFERMRMITEPALTESDHIGISDELDELWREYRQLHSMYNLDGSMKTGKDLEIAKRLTEYREASRDFYEWKERKGVFENAFFKYQQELIDQGIKEKSPEFKILVDEWIKKNTRIAIKDEYYERRGRVIDRISEILSKLPDNVKKELDQGKVWDEIQDLVSTSRDQNGQPDGSRLSKGTISEVKSLQENLETMRDNYMQRNGLTRRENEELSKLHDTKSQRNLNPQEAQRMKELYDKKNTFGLSKWESAELDALYQELKELSKKEATEYYADMVNKWLTELNTDKLYLETGSRIITKEGADILLDPSILDDLLSQNDKFADWFRANHIQKEVYDKESGQMIKKWERLYTWNVTQPQNEEYLETYEIKDNEGRTVRTIQGLPSLKYYARVVKPEYRNERVVGKTVDNQGNWLPKTMEQGAADDRFINKEYYELQQSDPKLFSLLEKLKEHHLKNQEGLSYKSRLYLDFPRIRKSNLEVLQTKGVKGISDEKYNAFTIWAKRVKEFLYGAKDDATSGFNDEDEFNLVRADIFDNEITNVPIHGLFDIDIKDVSTDIVNTMMRYMLSAERQKQLVKISPVARAVQSVVNDPQNKIKDLNKINKFNFIHRGVKTYVNKKGKSVRAQAVNNFIEREFEGQRMAGFTKDIKWMNNGANLLFKRASFGFFALNIPSALKNSYGAKFQAMLEASAGKDVNHITLQKGNGWAYATMSELSFGGQLYKKGAKNHRQQLVEIFDPVQDRFEEKFGEGISRTIAKDLASLSWLYNFRKWVELQASLQIFGGMMYHKMIEQVQPDGSIKKIPYMNAWQTVDGKIQLKEGVDPAWGITYDEEGNIKIGKEFKRFRNKIHQKMNDLQGAYAKFDQPEAQRYLAFRFLSYLRRYFTTMALNRFGFSGPITDPRPRFNPGAGDVQMGFYITFLMTMKETVTSLGKKLLYATPEEKAAILRVLTEVGLLIGTKVLMSLLFGWDPDDDEKFQKLRDRSGALPFPFTADDPDRDFNAWGFLENHALHLLMNIRAENEQFIPFPGYGLDDFTAMLDLKSIAFGPTIETYSQLFDDLANIATGSDKAYYKREVGPYHWQQEGGSKFMAHFARTIGLTGSSLDPAKAIKGFQSFQARAR